jgi:hypothetical protein
MKLFRTTTTIGVIAIALASCGGTKTIYVTDTLPDTTPKTTDAPIATPAPLVTAPPVAWTVEDEFISDVESGYGSVIAVTDQDLLDTGYTTCTYLRSGGTISEVVSMIQSSAQGSSDTEDLLATVTASAITNLCPDMSYKLNS